MIEWSLIFGLGFVIAWLLALPVLGAVRRRTERLTKQRVQATTPLSMPEIQAHKDQMRAEFAMATKRLEMNLENLRLKSGAHLHDISDKGEQIARLTDRISHIKRSSASSESERDQLESQARELRQDFQLLQDEYKNLQQDYEKLSSEQQRLMGQNSALEAENVAQRSQIQGLEAQIQAELDVNDELRRELTEAKINIHDKKLAQSNIESKLERREQTIQKLEANANALRAQIADLEQEAIKAAEVRKLSGDEKSKELDRISLELANNERALRTLEIKFSKLEIENQILQSRKAEASEEMTSSTSEIEFLKAENASLKSKIYEDWQDEKISATLLREHINDIAAEITVLTGALEGDDGYIAQALASTKTTDNDLDGDTLLIDRMRTLRRFADKKEAEDVSH